jgi:hypothetical protein
VDSYICIYTYLHPPTGADEVNGLDRQWQLVIARLHDEEEGDGSDMLFATLIRA